MKRRTIALRRPSVPLPAELMQAIHERPDELDFDPGTSDSSRLRILLEEGYEARRERVRRAQRAVSYRRWAEDAEAAEAPAEVLADTRRAGGVLGALGRRPTAET